MAISLGGFSGGGSAASTDTLDDVTSRGATTTNAITVGGLSVGTAYTMPTSDGTPDQVLTTNGSGSISFTTLNITGGLEYKGAFNATAGTPSIANAEKGDFYIIDTAGTIYGQTWAVGDHLLINEDMGGSVTNSKIDKIDNTETPASETVAGVIEIATNAEATAASVNNKALVPSNISDIALSSFNNDLTIPSDLNSLSDVTITAATSSEYLRYSGAAWVDAALNIADDTTPQLGGDLDVNGNSITSASNGNVAINPDGTGDISIGADLVPDTNVTHTIGSEDFRYISYYGDMNGAIRFKAKNDEGSSITKGQVVYIKGINGTVPTIGLADANDSAKMPAFGLAATDANDQAEVHIVSFGNLADFDTSSFTLGTTVYVSTTAGGLTATPPTGETGLIQNIGKIIRSDASAGIIKVGGAGRSNATPNLDQDKIFLGNASNQAVSTALSTIDLSSFNNDLTIPSALNDLSDVTITAAASSEYLRYSGAAWVDAALSIADDTTPSLGGNLDVNGNFIVSASNGDIEIAPDGTGSAIIKGNTTGGGTNTGHIKLNCENNSHHVSISSPTHSAYAGNSYNLIFPASVGTPGQVLKTDGGDGGNPNNVQLSWVSQSTGGAAPSVTTDSSGSDTTISTTTGIEEVHLINNTTNNVVITLPAASTAGAGYKYQIKRLGTGSVTIDPNGSEYIDHSGQTTFAIGAQYDSVTLCTDGSNWYLI